MTKPPNERPTLGELAAQGSGKDPWACPRCGCKDWRVRISMMVGNERQRQRVCRHCHHAMPTVEIPKPDGFKVVVVPEEEIEDEGLRQIAADVGGRLRKRTG